MEICSASARQSSWSAAPGALSTDASVIAAGTLGGWLDPFFGLMVYYAFACLRPTALWFWAFDQRNANLNIQYFANLAWGAPCFADPSGADFCAKGPQFIKADPMTVAAPYFDPSASGQYAAAEPPFLLRNGLTLRPGSPARCRGVDPTTLPGVPAQIAADMKNPSNVYFIYRDFNGNARPCMGSCWDLGAYQP